MDINKQALAIEETQTKLKGKILSMVLEKKPFNEISLEVYLLINDCANKIKIPSLADSTVNGLQKFASKVYLTVTSIFENLTKKQVLAINSVANNDYTTNDMDIVRDMAQGGEWRVPLDIYSKDYSKLIEDRITSLAKLEAKEDYTSRLSLRNLAEIQVRQQKHEEELQNYKNNGIMYIWIVPHANCSERCQPYQGRLYSLNGTSGVLDGIKYEPIEVATEVWQETSQGKLYKNGCLSGFNCRHTTKPYKKGYRPNEIPAKVIDKAREIDQKQRYLERGVRMWRDRAVLNKNINPKAYEYAKRKAIQWNDRYIQYSKDMKVAYYPDRTKII